MLSSYIYKPHLTGSKQDMDFEWMQYSSSYNSLERCFHPCCIQYSNLQCITGNHFQKKVLHLFSDNFINTYMHTPLSRIIELFSSSMKTTGHLTYPWRMNIRNENEKKKKPTQQKGVSLKKYRIFFIVHWQCRY